MPTVNLLPKEDRDREKKEQEFAHKHANKVDIVFTNPAKEVKSPTLPKANLPHESWWERLFGKPRPKSAVSTVPTHGSGLGPKIIPSPSLLPGKEPIVVAHLPPPLPQVHSTGGFWSRFLGGGTKSTKAVPKPPEHSKNVLPKPSPSFAPNLLGGSLPQKEPIPTPPLPPVKKDPSPFVQVPKPPTMPLPPIVPPRTNIIASGTIDTAKKPEAKHGSVEFTDIKKEAEKKVEVGKDSVTLLPEEFRPREAQIETKLVSTVLGSIIVSAAIVGGALFVVSLFQIGADTDLDTAQRQAGDTVGKINNKTGIRTEGETLQKTMEMVSTLLDNHVYWTKWLGVLEERTNVGIQWDTMAINAPLRTVLLGGIGTSLIDVAHQIVALRKTPQVESASITSVENKKKPNDAEALNAFTFKAEIKLKGNYIQEVSDPSDRSKNMKLTRGVITFTREEAEYDATNKATVNASGLDLKTLFEEGSSTENSKLPLLRQGSGGQAVSNF